MDNTDQIIQYHEDIMKLKATIKELQTENAAMKKWLNERKYGAYGIIQVYKKSLVVAQKESKDNESE